MQEIKNAYGKVTKIEILDLSETEEQKWFSAKKSIIQQLKKLKIVFQNR